ncbi:MAG: hypothetical protein B6I30_02415 [Desulfobacteraceae bacterium 4572_187]|nr:MAG: hypothetical protein B6I30_02415 [Desulfobacteraceae bacterium 4572_187]
MKIKKEYFILTGVMAALILYLVLHRSDRTHYKLPDITKISGKQISKLEIAKADKAVVLNKKDNTWYIEPKGYPADSDKVKNMLDVIENLTLTALVSESENYVRYDLRSDKKITVKAWHGKTLSREFDIGKAANTYQHTFVRLAKDSNVYHARGNFRQKFDQTVDDLRDKTVLSYIQKDIREITLSHEKKAITLTRKHVPEQKDKKKDKQDAVSEKPETKIVWQDAEGKKMDNAKVNRLLSFLNRLECETYTTDGKKEDFKNPTYALILKGKKEYGLSLFAKTDKDEKNYPAISSENDYPFFLSGSQVQSIKSKIDDIMEVKKN